MDQKHPLDILLEFFPTGSAEGDVDILDSVFVYANEFAKVINPPKRSPHILVGSKGSGKTAVLTFSKSLLDKEAIPNVLLTPIDISMTGVESRQSTGDIASFIYVRLLNSIVKTLGEQHSRWKSFDANDIYEYLVHNEISEPDFVSKSRQLLSEIARPIKIDIDKIASKLSRTTQDQISESVKRLIGKTGFYLFIDDTDQISDPNTPGHLNRIWGLLLAVRKLTTDVPELKAVVSLRTEIWTRLKRDDHGQRDQADHFESLVIKIMKDREHVGRVLDRRLALAAAAYGSNVDGYETFFEGSTASAPLSRERRSWRDLILVRTRERPRDAIRLVNMLAQHSIERGKSKISENTFQSCIPPFSNQIATFLSDEVRPEFPEFSDFFKSFSDVEFDQSGFTLQADTVKNHLTSVLPRYGATIHGNILDQSNPKSVFYIWLFLYQYQVLNARISDSSMPKGFRHLDPNEDPFFVTLSRWNEIQAALWEIDPAYRDYLISLQAAKAKRTGLPRKRPSKRRS